jgi:hypothetical protein
MQIRIIKEIELQQAAGSFEPVGSVLVEDLVEAELERMDLNSD